ncbi:DNA-binding transcriptional MocR family regulator [Sphingomonas sp. SORGH_AS 879]|nr:DNA-binding transcriptional MocR family regulator [Sphingomonas sp. SORGH_AS_0879]
MLLAQGAEIYRIPREADGPNLEVPRLMCERHRSTMFLLSSMLQNSTGTSISLHKARKLVEIAAEFDIRLVDDASYADLAPVTAGRPAVPLILLDQLEHVIHIGGFSQTLSPEIGVGYIVAGERFMGLLRVFRLAQGLANMLIPERVVYRFLHDGLYRRRCERIRSGRGCLSKGRPSIAANIAVWIAIRASPMRLLSRVGFTRLVRRTMKASRWRSI